MLPFGPPLLIANPTAGRTGASTLRRLVAALRDHGVAAEVATTEGRGHAQHLAEEAASGGRRFVVAVGGDGTVNEVVNGLVDPVSGQPRGADLVLGVVGTGSGCDLLRTFGLDRPPEQLADHLVGAHTQPLDLGRVHLRGPGGAPRVTLFANVAEVGYGGTVASLVDRLPRRLGRGRYPTAIVASVPGFRRVMTTVSVDGGTRTEPLCNVVVANGQFFGGGMHVAPRALPGDGLLDVQTWGGRPVDVIRAQPQLRHGRHLARDDVRVWRSRRVEVSAARALLVETDGDVVGRTPAAFDVLPGVLALKT